MSRHATRLFTVGQEKLLSGPKHRRELANRNAAIFALALLRLVFEHVPRKTPSYAWREVPTCAC